MLYVDFLNLVPAKGHVHAFKDSRLEPLLPFALVQEIGIEMLVTEEQPDGDLKIYFSGLTGGYSAKGVLGLDDLVVMEPSEEIPLVFACYEKWVQDAGICDSLAQVDFIEVHAFGTQPKSPNPLVDPDGYAKEQERLRDAYRRAYGNYFREHCPHNGLPARFTVHVVDVPDQAASYEFYGTALHQKHLSG